MSTPFQNRLVGTIIVAAAAIIFLPDLLNGNKITHEERFAAIPSAPSTGNIAKIKKFPTQKLSRLPQEKTYDDVAQDEQLSSTQSTDNLKITTVNKAKEFATVTTATAKSERLKENKKQPKKANSKVQIKANTVQTKAANDKSATESSYAWVIQLGSFREQHNVNNLINTLQKNGYSAFTKPIKTRHGKLIKVFVGPELSKVSLEKQLPKLKKLTKMQGKVARFKPAQ